MSPEISSRLPLVPAIDPAGPLLVGTGKVRRVGMDKRTANLKKKAALAEQGYIGRTALVKSADIDYLRAQWGFKTKEEAIRVSLKFLIEATKDGLKSIVIAL